MGTCGTENSVTPYLSNIPISKKCVMCAIKNRHFEVQSYEDLCDGDYEPDFSVPHNREVVQDALVDALHDCCDTAVSDVVVCSEHIYPHIQWCYEEGFIDVGNQDVYFPWFAFGNETEIFHGFYYYQCCSHSHKRKKHKRNRK
eukprot:396028_1